MRSGDPSIEGWVAVAIACRAIPNGFDALFVTAAELIDDLARAFRDGRLAAALGRYTHPAVLVVDEVLAVGDATFQNRCRTKFREMKEEGRTVILVSHSMSTVKDMCDEVAWLNQGELKMLGKTNEVVKAYNATV